MNSQDIALYERLKARYDDARASWQRPCVPVSKWQPLHEKLPRRTFDPDFALLSFKQDGGSNVNQHSVLSFKVEFSLARQVEILECSINIRDETGAWAFATNSAVIETPVGPLAAGTHCVLYNIVADLPQGIYEVGLTFVEILPEGNRELACLDKIGGFQVSLDRKPPCVGYSNLPVVISGRMINQEVIALIKDARGSLRLLAEFSQVVAGEQWQIPIALRNESDKDWVGSESHPLYLSYRWLGENGEIAVCDGLRSVLPGSRLAAKQEKDLALLVRAPDLPGRYRLQILPVQESHSWFDALGFVPGEQLVDVVLPRSVRSLRADDCRLRGQTGRLEGDSRYSEGKEGFLVFGPYIPLSAGRWRITWHGDFDPKGGTIRADVVSGGQSASFGETKLNNATMHEVALDILLEGGIPDAEFRLWIDALAEVRLTSIGVIPLDEPLAQPSKSMRGKGGTTTRRSKKKGSK